MGFEWWFGDNVLSNLSFIFSDKKGPGTVPELFWKLFALFLLEDCVCGVAKHLQKKN